MQSRDPGVRLTPTYVHANLTSDHEIITGYSGLDNSFIFVCSYLGLEQLDADFNVSALVGNYNTLGPLKLITDIDSAHRLM